MRIPIEDINHMVALYEGGMDSPAIGKQFVRSASSVCNILKRRGVKARPLALLQRKYPINEAVFGAIDCEEKAYWLGFVYADGCVYPPGNVLTIALAVEDKGHVEKFVALAGGACKEYHCKSNPKGVATVAIRSQRVLDDLRNHGVTPRKSCNIRMPELRSDLVRHFVRGYFDGDGCIYLLYKGISHQRYGLNIVSNREFLSELETIFRSELGVCHGRSTPLGTSGKARTLWFTVQSEIHSVLAYLYDGATVALDRKHELAGRILRNGFRDHRRAA